MDQLKTVQKYAQKLGITDDAIVVYAELAKIGHSSALELSRKTKLPRTQVYRLLDELKEVGLVSAEQLSYGTLFRALPFSNIESMLAIKESELHTIKRQLPALDTFFHALAGAKGNEPTATVRHFYGMAGIKQVTWNILKAKDRFCVFEVSRLSSFADKAFTRHHREEVIARGIKSFDLTNDTVAAKKELEPVDTRLSQFRHIPKDLLDIQFEVILYNDVVALLDYKNKSPMALEIHHPALKSMMQQLFDTMWAQAQPIKIT
jgi:sugar-specific transcriptional regulator TrmB